ncbi:sensor histidine kinase [Planomonospora venezuelensis]|uniref:Signal transduction histidine kinase n=1 Tax=Planomonospora venezuelensis TaxID=1999 RepID=A0A841DC63_PLAVE|nr:ATP-binding protein [Planomonospora venezuelensis]MBB5965695.1 signal transduction histidine kinase [Planomonospora venezuelensis]GIN02540.1 hypothetical protein Pve01_41980 [Planomonospora venezuelensis]
MVTQIGARSTGRSSAEEVLRDCRAGHGGPAEAMRGLLEGWSARTGIAVEVWALPGRRMPARITAGILAVMDEALSNVERHSRASSVSVAVTAGRREVMVTVSDGGTGFSGQAHGRGVAAMRTSFTRLGGSLTIRGTAGGGTTVSGAVPLSRW